MIPAVAYLRRSTTKQDTSLDDQRCEIERFAAAKCFSIVRLYVDSISGATGDERPEFLRMVEDAETKHDFSVVLCWNSARFGRMEADEVAHYRFLLKRTGVSVMYVAEDNIEGDAGAFLQAARSIQNRAYLKTLSRDVSRGALYSFQNGGLPGRRAPYGFDRMLLDENGKQKQRLKHGERVLIQKGWKMTLVPNDDGVEAVVVREIFESYVREEIGCSEIANRLHKRGVRPPRGPEWSSSTVLCMLKNPLYKGIICYGRVTIGKFHRVAGNGVDSAPEDGRQIRNPIERCATRIVPELALVTSEVWDSANRKRESRALDRSRRARGRGQTHPLSGIAKCADCDGPMLGMRHSGKNRTDHCYVCARHFRNKTCHRNSVCEDRLHKVIRDLIMNRVLHGGDLDGLRAAVERRVESRSAPDNSSDVKRQLADARSALDRAAQNLIQANPENVPVLDKAMTTLRQRVQSLESQLTAARSQTDPKALVEAIMSNAKRLLGDLFKSERSRLRAIMSEVVQRIELKFVPVAWGKKQVQHVATCDVYLRGCITTEQFGNPNP